MATDLMPPMRPTSAPVAATAAPFAATGAGAVAGAPATRAGVIKLVASPHASADDRSARHRNENGRAETFI
jgi:hypothetical protein